MVTTNDIIDRRIFISEKIDVLLASSITTLVDVSEEDTSLNNSNSNSLANNSRPAQAPLSSAAGNSTEDLDRWRYTISRDISTTKDEDERFSILKRINEQLSNPPVLFKEKR